ncbi:MAG TPA: class I SAM-dependent methyltransferase [Steroidobacteraceae bacterium]|jgi:ubiquinone/menaquinone biosynthesis C-methylase UbiE
MDMSTDTDWEEWGRRDPYFGVITNPRFRSAGLSENAKREFFASGESHVHGVLATIQKHIDPGFAPRTVVDFGCGVGRLLVPFAKIVDEVVGLDVSPSMLREAQRNCDEHGLRNVRLLESDDSLSSLAGTFDLIHSCIVFQHIPPERGRSIFSRLLRHLRPGGVGAIQLTYSKTRFASTHGIAPAPPPTIPSPNTSARFITSNADPAIQMNPYNVNEILFLMQCRGVQKFYVEFSDHGGELGIYLFFSLTGPVIAV